MPSRYKTRKISQESYVYSWKDDLREFLGITYEDCFSPVIIKLKHLRSDDVYVSNLFEPVDERGKYGVCVARGFGYSPEEAERNAYVNSLRESGCAVFVVEHPARTQ